MTDPIGDEMEEMGRGVAAAVRVPPYEVVVTRLRRRRRRRVGIFGAALAALAVAGTVVVPGLGERHGAQMPASRVTVAPPGGPGRLSLTDVSYDAEEHGILLGRRCTTGCHDVTLATGDRGGHYGPEVALAGEHRFVAAGPEVDVAYGPGLAVSHDGGTSWTELRAPAPVADLAFVDGVMSVLLTPSQRPARLWQGPAAALSWSQLHAVGAAPGSDSSARLSVAGPTFVVTSTRGQPRVAILSAAGWTARALAICSRGSEPSVSAVSPDTWWIACRNEVSNGHQVVVVTTDAGVSYRPVAAPPGDDLDKSVVAVSRQTAYLYGGPSLLVTENGGSTWRTALDVGGLGPPHVPPGHRAADVWVLAPGSNTVYRELDGDWRGGVRLS